jgi:hypothetical protein
MADISADAPPAASSAICHRVASARRAIPGKIAGRGRRLAGAARASVAIRTVSAASSTKVSHRRRDVSIISTICSASSSCALATATRFYFVPGSASVSATSDEVHRNLLRLEPRFFERTAFRDRSRLTADHRRY